MPRCLLSGVLALLAGCASIPGSGAESAARSDSAVSADAQAFVRAQASRVKALGDFASRGSAELRWTDERGDHFEQAQVELAWREAGNRMALRADKIGERLAWAGADADQWWIFEIKREPSRVTLGHRGSVPRDSMLPFAGPESVMELMAARPWPASATAGEAQDGARWIEWRLERPIGAWCRSRALVAAPGALPSRMELLDVIGKKIASAALSRPLSVEIDDLPPGAWPEVAGTMHLETGPNGAAWDIFWDAPGTDPARLKDRIFDLKVLLETLRPQEVIDQDQARDARSP
jgi:hypothetical protein